MNWFKRKDRDFTIVRPTDADIGTCAAMIFKAMGKTSISKEALEQTLKTPNIIVLVAKIKERIVGLTTGLIFSSTNQSSPKGRIDFLTISDEESAKKGLYGLLIDEFIEELKKRVPDAKYVDTNVPTSNPHFVATYSLRGFMIVGFIKGENSITDIVVLRKNIAEQPFSRYTV